MMKMCGPDALVFLPFGWRQCQNPSIHDSVGGTLLRIFGKVWLKPTQAGNGSIGRSFWCCSPTRPKVGRCTSPDRPDLEFLDFDVSKKVKNSAKKHFLKKNRGKLLGRDTSFAA